MTFAFSKKRKRKKSNVQKLEKKNKSYIIITDQVVGEYLNIGVLNSGFVPPPPDIICIYMAQDPS